MPTYFLIFLFPYFRAFFLTFLLALLYFTLLASLLPCFVASLLPCFLASFLPYLRTYLLTYLLSYIDWYTLTYIDMHRHSLTYIDMHWHSWTYIDIHWHTLTYLDIHTYRHTDIIQIPANLLIMSLLKCPSRTCWRSVSGLIGLQAFHHLDPRLGVWCLEIPGSSTKWAPTRLINHLRVGWSSKCRNLWDLMRMRVSTVLQGTSRVSKKWAFCGDVLLNVSYLSLWEHSRVINVNSVDRF